MLTSSLVGTINQVNFEPDTRYQAHLVRVSPLIIGMIAYVPVVVDVHECIWTIIDCQPEDGDVICVDNAMHTVN